MDSICVIFIAVLGRKQSTSKIIRENTETITTFTDDVSSMTSVSEDIISVVTNNTLSRNASNIEDATQSSRQFFLNVIF